MGDWVDDVICEFGGGGGGGGKEASGATLPGSKI